MGKKENRKIQDFDGIYAFLRHYVDFMLRMAYRRIKYVGLEKVPADGAVIYAPNHTNALMDALVILAMDRKQKVFVARADIFKNPKVAKILRFLKIMPIMRIRDGMDEVRKNTEIIHKSVDVLLDKVMDGRLPLYIVPVGLEYGNFFRFRSTVLVQIGEPINVSAYLREHASLSQPEVMNLMKDDLSERMKEVILYIPDDEHYDATLETCAAVINQQVDTWRKEHPGARRHALTTRFSANKMTLGQIARLRTSEPRQAAELLGRAADIHREREERGISLGSVIKKHPFWSRLFQLLVLIVTLPYTIPAGVLTLPVTGLSAFLFSKMKDRAFYYCTLPWEWALGLSIALVPATVLCQEAYRLLRLAVSDLRLLCAPKLRRSIRDLRRQFLDLLHKEELA